MWMNKQKHAKNCRRVNVLQLHCEEKECHRHNLSNFKGHNKSVVSMLVDPRTYVCSPTAIALAEDAPMISEIQLVKLNRYLTNYGQKKSTNKSPPISEWAGCR